MPFMGPGQSPDRVFSGVKLQTENAAAYVELQVHQYSQG